MSRKTHRRHTTATTLAPSVHIPALAWIIGVVIIIAAIGIKRNFNQVQTPTPAPYKNDGQWQTITNPKAVFYSQIFKDRDRTFISIPIKFSSGTQIAWLYLHSNSKKNISTYLIAHPTLETLDWNRLDDGMFHLYQREPTYTSFANFLSHPPAGSDLMMDEFTQKQPKFTSLQHQILPKQFDSNSIKYILTTYIKPRIEGGISYYENNIDASDGIVNQKDNLTWELHVPTAASASPYYLGNIHVDYQR